MLHNAVRFAGTVKPPIVKPPIVDPPRKGYCIIIPLYTSLQRMVHGTRKFCFPIVAIQFEPPRRGQPLYKGQSM